MLELNFKNILKLKKNGLTKSAIAECAKKIQNNLKLKKELPFLQILNAKNKNSSIKMIESLEKFSTQIAPEIRHLVLLGIGGSALGAKSISQALKNNQKAKYSLFIADNIDPDIIDKINRAYPLEKTLFLVISKSGNTMETLAQFLYFWEKIKKAKLDLKKHFLIITAPDSGTLRKIAKKENIPTFSVPNNLGGRFSVLSVVGLLPAHLLGINCRKILKGAQKTMHVCLAQNYLKNPALQLACIQYLLAQQGKNINILMTYAQKLGILVEWYNQLLAESIGKNNIGITPCKAIGPTDQHSQIQLYNEGPNDKLIIFLEQKKHAKDIKISNPFPENSDLEIFNKKISFQTLSQLEKIGTADALNRNERPNISITIPQINEENLGALFTFFCISISFLAELYGINAFDQPGVELGKKIIKQLLIKHSKKLN